MCRMHGTFLWAILFLIAAGCTKQTGTDPAETNPQPSDAATAAEGDGAVEVAQLEGPAASVRDFLEAVRTGNDEKATAPAWPITEYVSDERIRALSP